MKLRNIILACSLLGLTTMSVTASEFDKYLQEKKIIDTHFKITNKAELNDLLKVLSAEDSKTFPLQIDHNTIIEKLEIDSEKTVLTGLIITPDFSQFEQDLGRKEVTKLIRKNLLNNCNIFFEHEYQRHNPYRIELHLNSTDTNYSIDLSQKDCQF
jgi:hypothetical protein